MHDFLHPDRVVIGADDQSAAIRVASLYVGCARPAHGHRPGVGRDDQVRQQRLPGHQDLVHQRRRRDLRGGRRRRQRRGRSAWATTSASATTSCARARATAARCFPKDTPALVRIAEDAGYDFGLLRGVIAVNEEQFDRVVDKIADLVGGDLDGAPHRACWGLTFKARTDDLRDSPALRHRPTPPGGRRQRAGLRPDGGRRPVGRAARASRSCADPYAACEGADVLVVLTEWDEFRWLDFDKVAAVMAAARGRRRPQPARPRGLRSSSGLRLSTGIGPLMARIVVTGGAGFLGSHLCDRAARPGRRGRRRRQPHHRPGPEHRAPLRPRRASRSSSTTSREYLSGARRGRRRPALRQPGVAPGLPRAAHPDPEGRHPRHPQRASAWPRPRAPGSSWRPPARSTATPWCTRSPRPTGATSTRSGPGASTTRPSASPRPSPWPTTAPTGVDVRIVRIFNTYGPRMRPERRPGRVQLHRPGPRRASRSPSTATAPRPAASATSTTRSAASWPCSTATSTGPVNIGNPDEFTIRELADLVIEVTGSHLRDRARAPPRRRPRQAPPRHHEGPHRARLGTRDPAPRRHRTHRRLVPRGARSRLTRTTGHGDRQPRSDRGRVRAAEGQRRPFSGIRHPPWPRCLDLVEVGELAPDLRVMARQSGARTRIGPAPDDRQPDPTPPWLPSVCPARRPKLRGSVPRLLRGSPGTSRRLPGGPREGGCWP